MKATTPLSTRWEIQQAEGWASAQDVSEGTRADIRLSDDYAVWRRKRSASYFILKRTLDIVVALIALLICAPAMALIALFIWLEDGGPVIFSREVIGQHGRMFKMFKFRTMCAHAEDLLRQDEALLAEYHQRFKLRQDPRVTRLGRILRKYSLDEAPQLFNILAGQMSLVGPRCVPPVEADLFGEVAEMRVWVKPGLSGLWQVSGRSDTTYAERIRLDRAYVERCSFWLDVSILLRTLPAVARGVGAY
ncbi:MAG TPA: sugar transferase [Ktedonobacterales bacterium]